MTAATSSLPAPRPARSNIYGVLSADRKSVTWTVDTKSTVALRRSRFDNIYYDVASTVAAGTSVDVTLATSAGAVAPTSRSNAVVGRVLTATSTSPVVYIGENNQTAGQVTVTEAGRRLLPGRRGLQQHARGLHQLQPVRERAVRLGPVGQGHRR